MSQLHLFKGKRQRGTRPPPPKEITLHIKIAQMVGRWGDDAWKWTHIPTGEKRDIIDAAKLLRMGTKAGFPDFLFLKPMAGGSFWLEVKRQGRGLRLSDAQQVFADWCEANCYPHAVVDTDEAAMAVLFHWGVLRRRVTVMA